MTPPEATAPRSDPDNCPALYAALATAQATMRGATKDSDNPFFHSRYADLASVWDAWRAVGPANGLAVLQFPEVAFSGEPEVYTFTSKAGEQRSGVRVATTISVRTRLAHLSGEYVEDVVCAMLPSGDPQAVGSAITYLRRYGLSAVVGIAPEDDDAEGTTKPVHQHVDTSTGEVREPMRKVPAPAPITLDSSVPFGKHKGKTAKEAGRGYFEFLSDKPDFAEGKGKEWHTFTVAALAAFDAAESPVDRAAKPATPDLSMPDLAQPDPLAAASEDESPAHPAVSLAAQQDEEINALTQDETIPKTSRDTWGKLWVGLGDTITADDRNRILTNLRAAKAKAAKGAAR